MDRKSRLKNSLNHLGSLPHPLKHSISTCCKIIIVWSNLSNPSFVKLDCRYPFYMLACVDTEWKLLTWVRYTIWIPLYPLGVLAEGKCSYHMSSSRETLLLCPRNHLLSLVFYCWSAVAVIQSIPIFDETKLLSIPLPKFTGLSLSFSYILQVYLVLMFLGKSYYT